MWNMALGCGHVLSDAPAQANNFNLFIRTDGRCPGRPIAFSLSIEQIGVQVGMANALSLGMNHRQIDPKRLCPRPDCGRSEDFGRCLIAIFLRSEERRVGKEWVSKGGSRWSPLHKKKNMNDYINNLKINITI